MNPSIFARKEIFQLVTLVMKIRVFWDVTPSRLVNICLIFEIMRSLHELPDSEVQEIKLLRKAINYLPVGTAPFP